MSVSFIYQNLQFYYRIDHLTRALPVVAWGCRDLPVRGESADKEAMMTDIRNALKAYHRSLPARKKCKECDSDLHLRENESNLCDTCNPITT
jgi:hypothetical protein